MVLETRNTDTLFWKIYNGKVPIPAAAKLLGLEILHVDPEGGTVSLQFQATELFLNPAGLVQGGLLCAMLDESLGIALLATLRTAEFAPTLELKVQFINAARPGSIVGHGRVISKGGRIAYLAGELMQDDMLIASATATAIIQSLR